MATGIAQTSYINEYVGVACELIGSWGKLTDVQRATMLVNSAETQLNKFSVPIPGFGWDQTLRPALAIFNYQLWLVELLPGKWKLNVKSGEEDKFKKGVAKLADTIYHEHRHCEQWFRIARWLASGGWKVPNIMGLMRIPEGTVKIAVTQTAVLSPEEQREASDWYQSVYAHAAAPKSFGEGTGAGNLNARDIILGPGQLKPLKPTAGQPLKPELVEISQMRQNAQYQQYRNLPEEEDAHAVGTAVQKGIYQKMGLQGLPTAPEHKNVSAR